MVAKPTSAKSHISDGDIAANEALLHHAEASRLAKSWLSGAFGGGEGKDANRHTDETEDDEADLKKEQELFGKSAAQYSEIGGIGFKDPTAGNGANAGARGADQTTAFLRKHLLRGHPNSHTTAKPRPRPQGFSSKRVDDSEDEEEGRSGLGKGKSKSSSSKVSSRGKAEAGLPTSETVSVSQDPTIKVDEAANALSSPAAAPPAASAQARTTKKRGSSYLDEVLASRAAKKNKKAQKVP